MYSQPKLITCNDAIYIAIDDKSSIFLHYEQARITL